MKVRGVLPTEVMLLMVELNQHVLLRVRKAAPSSVQYHSKGSLGPGQPGLWPSGVPAPHGGGGPGENRHHPSGTSSNNSCRDNPWLCRGSVTCDEGTRTLCPGLLYYGLSYNV